MTPTKQSKSNTTQSPTEQAHAVVEEVRRSLTEAETALAELTTERDAIADQMARGSLTADSERLAELDDVLIPRKAARVAYLRDDALRVAEADLVAAELHEMAGDLTNGPAARHATYSSKRAEAEAKIAEGIAELHTVTSEWEAYARPVITRAASAGFSEDQADPLSRIVVAGKGQEAHLVIDGEPLTAPRADRAITSALSRADAYLAGTIARGLEARRWGLSVTQIGA